MDELSVDQLLDEIDDDIITTALEGGINFWAHSANVTRDTNGRLVSITVTYEEGEETTTITREQLHDAVKLDAMCTVDLEKLAVREWFENHDAGDADAVFQKAMFGQLVYG